MYQILLSISGVIIMLLLGIVINSSISLFRTVREMNNSLARIEVTISERNQSCIDKHHVINRRLDEHGKRLDEHEIKLTEFKPFLNK